MNAKLAAQALRLLADAVEAEGAPVVPAPTTEAPPCAWVAIKQCGLPVTSARRAVRDGEISASRVGRDVYVLRADVERFVEARRIDRGEVDLTGDDRDEVTRALRVQRLQLVGGRR
jgi:hypothetical protein